MRHTYTALLCFAAALSIETTVIATLDGPRVATRIEKGRASREGKDEDRRLDVYDVIARASKSDALVFLLSHNKDMERLFNELKIGSSLFESTKLQTLVDHVRSLTKLESPMSYLASLLVDTFKVEKLSEMIVLAKQNPHQKALANEIEAGLFDLWYEQGRSLERVFVLLNLKFDVSTVPVETAADKLFNNPGLKTLLGYASKLREKGLSNYVGIENELNGQRDVAAVLTAHFNNQELLQMIIVAKKSPERFLMLHIIESGLVGFWRTKYSTAQFAQLLGLKMSKKLFSHPLISTMIMFADDSFVQRSAFIRYLVPKSRDRKRLKKLLVEASKDKSLEPLTQKLERMLKDFDVNPTNKPHKSQHVTFAEKEKFWSNVDLESSLPLHNSLKSSPRPTLASSKLETKLESPVPAAPPPTVAKQHSLSNDARPPIAMSKSKPNPTSHLSTAPLRNPAKPPPLPSDALSPPVRSQIKTNPAMPSPRVPPSDTKEQLKSSIEVLEPSTSSKPPSPRPTAPVSNSLFARFRRWLAAVWAKVRAKFRRSPKPRQH